MAQLIEEDGEGAPDDLSGQPHDRTQEGNNRTKDRVQFASAGPASTHVGAAMLRPSRQWGVQLGAFTSRELAEAHLDNAERLQPDVLTRERSALVPKDDGSGSRGLYRAIFGPMDEAQAKATCEKLRAGGMHCFAMETDEWGQAVRR